MNNNIITSFILSFLAGVSTLIGSLIIVFKHKNKNKMISLSLAFSAGVMISISLLDLLPSCYLMILDTKRVFIKVLLTAIFMNMGIIISMLIDKYLPDGNYSNNKKLYRVGIISMIAIILHNIPEGIATFITSSYNLSHGIKLSIAIALHNIPEGITIAIPVYYATKNRKKALLYSLISGMSEVGGSIIAYLFLSPIINKYIMAALYALIAGIMLHISIYELIPESYKKCSLKLVLKWFILGFVLIIINHVLIK